MANGKVRSQEEANGNKSSEPILSKCYSDFIALVTKSYYPRFSGLSRETEPGEPKEEPTAPESCKKPQASQPSFTRDTYEEALPRVSHRVKGKPTP